MTLKPIKTARNVIADQLADALGRFKLMVEDKGALSGIIVILLPNGDIETYYNTEDRITLIGHLEYAKSQALKMDQ